MRAWQIDDITEAARVHVHIAADNHLVAGQKSGRQRNLAEAAACSRQGECPGQPSADLTS